jgi:von Willebrand factor type A domain
VKSWIFIAVALFTSLAGSPLQAQKPAAVSDRLEAERLEQSGTVITIIFDDSGSMAGSKLKQAKAAFRQWIAAVPASYRLGLVALNAGPLVPLDRDNRQALVQAVDRINASGGTPLVTTIRTAIAEIDRRRGVIGPYERHIMLVFTDGEDTTSEGVAGVQRELARASDAGIETVGIGYHGEGNYMRKAATRYYDANNLTELQQSLAKVDAEIGDTSDIVIDERTRATMQHVVASAAPFSTTEAPESKPATSKSKGRSPFRLSIVLIIIAWIVLRTMMRRKAR